jgi:hypothetical protein
LASFKGLDYRLKFSDKPSVTMLQMARLQRKSLAESVSDRFSHADGFFSFHPWTHTHTRRVPDIPTELANWIIAVLMNMVMNKDGRIPKILGAFEAKGGKEWHRSWVVICDKITDGPAAESVPYRNGKGRVCSGGRIVFISHLDTHIGTRHRVSAGWKGRID